MTLFLAGVACGAIGMFALQVIIGYLMAVAIETSR